MQRPKSYDVPHKGLRNALSQLQTLAGKTDYTDHGEVTRLYQLGRDVFVLLSIHAEDENEVTLAELEQRCPGCSEHDLDDHIKIHSAQAALEGLLESIYTASKAGQDASAEGEEFYLAVSEFHAYYLQHTAEEERVTQPLLWKHFSDGELGDHRSRIMARMPPGVLLTWFRFIFPALSHKERVGLFTGFKRMAPEPFFMEGRSLVKNVLSEVEFARLEKSLEEG